MKMYISHILILLDLKNKNAHHIHFLCQLSVTEQNPLKGTYLS